MPSVLQLRRGTTSQNNAFTGAIGELSYDTEVDTIRVHDGSTAGGFAMSTASATETLTNKTTTNLVQNGTATGTAIKDEDDMSSNSATHLATQQSIKAYVDNEISSLSSTSISQGNSNVTVADSGTGNVTIEVDGTDRITTVAATTTTATGHSLVIGAGSNSAGGSIKFLEGTDNGTNGVTLKGPASVADIDVVLPSSAGTLALENADTTGTAAIATTVTVADESSDTSCNVLFVTAATGDLAPKSGTNLTFDSANGNLTTTTFTGTATAAQYADLAEMYASNGDIEPGTVVCFIGDAKVGVCDIPACKTVAGIVSTDPAHLMNSTQEGVALAIAGRVPCKVIGPVDAGDMMISAGGGRAKAFDADVGQPAMGTVIGKAIESHVGDDDTTGVIEVLAMMM